MTWDQIGAAIERARLNVDQRCHDLHGGGTRSWNCYCVNEREALLDVLAAIHQIHIPRQRTSDGFSTVPMCAYDRYEHPCRSERVVIDALTRMGALPEGNDEED